MKTSITLTSLALFGVVAGIYWYMQPLESPVSEPVAPETGEDFLANQTEGDIVLMQLQDSAKKQTITLERIRSEWFLKYPVFYPADPMMAEGLASAIRLSRKARRLVPEKGWAEYGLERPSLKIGIRQSRSARRRYLYLGDLSPVSPHVYARWDREGEYFLVDQDLKKAFDRSVYSLRQKRVFRTPLAGVAKIRVRTRLGEEYELALQKDRWVWMEPVELLGAPVDPQTAEEIFRHIQALYVKEFLDDETLWPETLGLSPWGPRVQVSPQSGLAEVIDLGSEVKDRDAVYAQRQGEPALLLISREHIQRLFEIAKTARQKAPEAVSL